MLSTGNIFNFGGSRDFSNILLQAGKNISNATSIGASLIKDSSAREAAQEAMSFKAALNEQSRIDAKEQEDFNRFKSERQFNFDVFRDGRDHGFDFHKFNNLSAGQRLQGQLSRESVAAANLRQFGSQAHTERMAVINRENQITVDNNRKGNEQDLLKTKNKNAISLRKEEEEKKRKLNQAIAGLNNPDSTPEQREVYTQTIINEASPSQVNQATKPRESNSFSPDKAQLKIRELSTTIQEMEENRPDEPSSAWITDLAEKKGELQSLMSTLNTGSEPSSPSRAGVISGQQAGASAQQSDSTPAFNF